MSDINIPRLTKAKKVEYIALAERAFEEDYHYAEDIIKAGRQRRDRKNRK